MIVPDISPIIMAAEYMARARLYRTQANNLADMESHVPNWPKFFLMGHAIELALKGYLAAAEPGFLHKQLRDEHDLMARYKGALRYGLKNNLLVQEELPWLSDLHKAHYARYPQMKMRPVPAYISQYDDMLDQLFEDIRAALGPHFPR